MFKKQNLPLLIGFLIPLSMLAFIAFSIYVPGLFNSPQYDFVYISGDYNTGYNRYAVQNSKIIMLPTPTPYYYSNQQYIEPQLFLHNSNENKSTPITFDEASKLDLSVSSVSPDGYEIKNGNTSGGFLFGYSRDYNKWYIVGNYVSKELKLSTINTNYSNFKFLGWILNNG